MVDFAHQRPSAAERLAMVEKLGLSAGSSSAALSGNDMSIMAALAVTAATFTAGPAAAAAGAQVGMQLAADSSEPQQQAPSQAAKPLRFN